jgi:hypothetical protein
MADLHIEDFYKDVGLILLHLYSTFPRKQILFVEDVSGAYTTDEFGLPSPRYVACFSAMVWLGEQGYLRYDSTIRQEALDQAVLSEKGFLLLSSRSEMPWLEPVELDDLPPSIMEESLTNVAQLRRAIGTGSSILIRQSVHHLLSNASAF